MSVTKAIYDQALSGTIVLISPEGHRAVLAKLATLREELATLQNQLGYAAQDYPDLRENAIYGDLKMKIQLDVPREAYDWRDTLDKAHLVDQSPKNRLGFGSVFTATLADTTATYRLTGPVEVALLPDAADIQLISYLSPLGRAVWGRRAGDAATFEAGGQSRSVSIDSLHPA